MLEKTASAYCPWLCSSYCSSLVLALMCACSLVQREAAPIPKAIAFLSTHRLTRAFLKCLEVRTSATQSVFENRLLPFSLTVEIKGREPLMSTSGIFVFAVGACLWKFACPLTGAGREKNISGESGSCTEVDSC